MRLFGSAEFAVTNFFGKSEEEFEEKFGPNGLPVCPSSVKILGRFQFLKSLFHPHLCAYLDVQRGKYDRLFVVEEFHRPNLKTLLKKEWRNGLISHFETLQIGWQVANALNYLHKRNIVHRALSLKNIVLAKVPYQDALQVRLAQYGMFYMTKAGADITFPLGEAWYLAPEALAEIIIAPCKGSVCGPKSDVWSLGMVLLEMNAKCCLEEVWNFKQWFPLILRLIAKSEGKSIFIPLINALKGTNSDFVDKISPEIRQIIEYCLTVEPKNRPTIGELLSSTALKDGEIDFPIESPFQNLDSVFRCCQRTKLMTPQHFRYDAEMTAKHKEWMEWPISERPIIEAYHLWKLSGPSPESILEKKGIIKTVPPILAIPELIVGEMEFFGKEEHRHYTTDLGFVVLSQENLAERLKQVSLENFYPSLELRYASNSLVKPHDSHLPTKVKERDIGYQLERMILFDSLINAFPYKSELLWREARVDIAPLYRGHVWAGLLGVRSDVDLVYNSLDKLTATQTDRQIDVDIPRCHQYDSLLSSPSGHEKLKRVLKAWVLSNPRYVYWQGLDSLAAPFIWLHFNNEALAFACLQAFIPRYLHNFFLYDNSAIIQEYLAVFSLIIAFHDPELSTHLKEIGFYPELYAIPWFLTMFAHVFPLHKLFHLWDTLLLGDHSFPICVGVAIMSQLRDRLLTFGFNECILLFSDLPDVDIERCVTESVHFFCRTPKSVLYRQHAPPLPAAKAEGKGVRSGSFTADYSLSLLSSAHSSAFSSKAIELDMSPVALSELRAGTCPRISVLELMKLTGIRLDSSKQIPSPRKEMGKTEEMGVVFPIDIRGPEEFHKGTYPGSWNIPFNTDLTLPDTSAVAKLAECKSLAIIVVFSSWPEHMLQFGGKLVSLGYSRVCTLHGGVQILRQANLLTVPPAEI